MDNLSPICPKIIWPYISLSAIEFILKYFCIMGHNRLTKFALVSLPQKSSFNAIVQFEHNLGQNHKTLCPRKLCIMIHSLKILRYSLIGYSSYTKVEVNLPKIFPFWARAIWTPKLCNVMSHDSLSEGLFELLWHDATQYR